MDSAATTNADDHDGCKREEVVRYLRAEANRDVPDQFEHKLIYAALSIVADYLSRN